MTTEIRFIAVFRREDGQWKPAPYPWFEASEDAKRLVDWLKAIPGMQERDIQVARIEIERDTP